MTDDSNRKLDGAVNPIPDKKPYTYVTLTLHETEDHLQDRYEVRVSTFVEFDVNPGRRAITRHPSKDEALEIAKEIARRERARTEG